MNLKIYIYIQSQTVKIVVFNFQTRIEKLSRSQRGTLIEFDGKPVKYNVTQNLDYQGRCALSIMISADGHFPQIHDPISFHFGMFGCTRRLYNLVLRGHISLTSTRASRRALAMFALKRTLSSPTNSP